MDRQQELNASIADVVAKFGKDQMGVPLELVSLSLRPDTLLITLRSGTSPAEKDLAKGKGGHTLLVNLYSRAFDSVKQVLEAHIERILERPVTEATMTVEPKSGHGMMSFKLTGHPDYYAAED